MDDAAKKAIRVIEERLCTGQAKGKNIVVLDRGWVFVGNLTKLEDDGYLLTDCKNIRRWEGKGFGGLTQSADNVNAVLDECAPVRFKERAMIFCVPVGEGWK